MPNGQSKFSLRREVEYKDKEIAILHREIKALRGKIDGTIFRNGEPFSSPIGDKKVTFLIGSKFIVIEPFGDVITLKPLMDPEPDNPTYIRLSDESWDKLFCQDVNKGETNVY